MAKAPLVGAKTVKGPGPASTRVMEVTIIHDGTNVTWQVPSLSEGTGTCK